MEIWIARDFKHKQLCPYFSTDEENDQNSSQSWKSGWLKALIFGDTSKGILLFIFMASLILSLVALSVEQNCQGQWRAWDLKCQQYNFLTWPLLIFKWNLCTWIVLNFSRLVERNPNLAFRKGNIKQFTFRHFKNIH